MKQQWTPLEPFGMTMQEAKALYNEIQQDYPMLVLNGVNLPGGTYGITLWYRVEASHTIRSESMWNEPAPVARRIIAQAMVYGFVKQGFSNDEAEEAAVQAMIPLLEAWSRQRSIRRVEGNQ